VINPGIIKANITNITNITTNIATYFIVVLFAASSSWGLAHAMIETSSPENGGVLENTQTELVITFSEPIETMFSVFELHTLDVPADAEHEVRASAANAAMAQVFNMDATSLRNIDMLNSGQSATVTLSLPEVLEPGSYALMWRVLSIDSHSSQDFITFVVADSSANTD
jgi:copper resistance protein C